MHGTTNLKYNVHTAIYFNLLDFMFVDPCIIVQILQWKIQQYATVLLKIYYSLF